MTTQFPAIHQIDRIVIEEPKTGSFSNQLQFFAFNGAKNNIIRIDIVFDAGRWTENCPLVSMACSALIKSGTSKYSAEEIEQQIDQLGSTIKVSSGYNSFTFSIYCINKYLEETLSIFKEIIFNYEFPEEELQLYKQKAIARLKVNQTKNDYIADALFKKSVFGNSHPYGYETEESAINKLNRLTLIEYCKTNFHLSKSTVFISGKYDKGILNIVESKLGEGFLSPMDTERIEHPIISSASRKITEKIQGAVQSAIIIGGLTINHQHEDYYKLNVLNTVLGGYFGSRLMKNIREDKGYTYGIYSEIQNFRNASVFSISTETDNSYTQQCLDEIYKEIGRLRNELIAEEELDRARSYMMGRLLKLTDGPFVKMNTFRSYFVTERALKNIQKLVACVKNVDALALREVAQKHLNTDLLYEVVVR